MKNLKWFVFVLILAGICFITCENPIMERWWRDKEPEVVIVPGPGYPGGPGPVGPSGPEYIFITQIVVETIIETETIYETIIAYIPILVDQPPSVIAQHIEIIGIDFIIFAGNADGFNTGPVPPATTQLTPAEIARNNEIVREMAMELVTQWDLVQEFYITNPGSPSDLNPNIPYFLLLHGHANPVDNTPGEGLELRNLSMHRANAAQNAITGVNFESRFPNPPTFLPNFPSYGSRSQALRSPPGPPTGSPDTARIEFDIDPFQIFISPNVPGTRPAGATLSPAEKDSLTDLISIKGYGGGRNLTTAGSSTYASLNRRVEAILFTVRNVPQTPPPIYR